MSRSNVSSRSSDSSIFKFGSAWFQKKINIRPVLRGCHLITDEILKQVPEITKFAIGLLHIEIMHTSASLALNENWDPDVRVLHSGTLVKAQMICLPILSLAFLDPI
ncbi:unnamed protein product [Larinioides sclopetarius]|uniref:Uncharacterized protein n=1 Tax=Larinioides sclopetarius TaxID=280406 RepID=A0AAV2BF67_9ARAC